MTDINVGQLSDMINNKLDIDAGNASAQTSAGLNANGIRTIIETYVNGTSGYRIWSDGYCEQWGVSPSGSDLATVTVSLVKTFSDNNYNVLAVQKDGPSGNYTNGIRVVNYSVSSFQINYRTGDITTAYWKASGYLATGQY